LQAHLYSRNPLTAHCSMKFKSGSTRSSKRFVWASCTLNRRIRKGERPATIAGCAGSTETRLPLAKNTVVRASAGTGKTYKLVSTWVDLGDAGVGPRAL